MLHAVQVGSPPRWDDAPAEFQADLAALERLDDEALWRIARSRKTEADMERFTPQDFSGWQAGLRPWERIVAVNGQHWREMRRLVQEAGIGGTLVYTVERGAQRLKIAVPTHDCHGGTWTRKKKPQGCLEKQERTWTEPFAIPGWRIG